LRLGIFVYWWRRREFAILASQCACMRIVVHRLAAVLLEFPVHPASVPDADSFPDAQIKIKKPTKKR
jgi:hypothetical protein